MQLISLFCLVFLLYFSLFSFLFFITMSFSIYSPGIFLNITNWWPIVPAELRPDCDTCHFSGAPHTVDTKVSVAIQFVCAV